MGSSSWRALTSMPPPTLMLTWFEEHSWRMQVTLRQPRSRYEKLRAALGMNTSARRLELGCRGSSLPGARAAWPRLNGGSRPVFHRNARREPTHSISAISLQA